MKYILTYIFLFLSTASFAQFYPQNSGTQNHLYSISFLNANTGWACGDDVWLSTTNGGAVWDVNTLTGEWKSIKFINSTTGFIAGRFNKLKKTTDAGASWTDISLSSNVHWYKINFKGNTGVISGSNGNLFYTNDAGVSWVSRSFGDSTSLFSSSIINENTYFVCGSAGGVYKTSNAGITFIDLSLEAVNPFFTIHFLDEQTGWVSGCCGMYFKTINGGASWTPEVYLTLGQTIWDASWVSSMLGFEAGDGFKILRTTNAGSSWEYLQTNVFIDLKSISMADAMTGYAAGMDGTILKTVNGGGQGTPIGINQISVNVPVGFKLHQNYPNPFNPETTIKFEIPFTADAEISVLDVSGREIFKENLGRITSGVYEYRFNAGGLSSGIYHYIVKASNIYEAKKMTVVK